jgi:probable HAF family extracellular repeat protein
MSANGNVVAGYFETASHEPRAYVWTAAGGTQALPLPDPQPASNEQYAKGVSADGTRVVGWSRSASGYHGFLWSNSTGYLATSLGLSGGSASYALRISGDGSTVLGRTDFPGPSNTAWLWSASNGYTTLPTVSGVTTIGPTAISGNGTTVVGAAFPTEFADPILWTAQTGTVRIADILTASGVDLTGWTLGTAYGVSFDGTRIVGVGEFGGERRGWLVTVPAPGAASILAAGVTCFGLRRRR